MGDDKARADVLTVNGRPVARYVTVPEVETRRGPRPYLHPVRTLAGTVVTDILPEDHPHHLGASVALQSVARAGADGVNLWGGRTYVRDVGYTWLEDHGRIEHVAWTDGDGAGETDGAGGAGGVGGTDSSWLGNRMRWCAPDGSVLIEEERHLFASPVDGDPNAWRLAVGYTLTNPATGPDGTVVLGSPATNGRVGKVGYGGFFWRAAPGTARVLDPVSDIEAEVNGSTQPWVALIGGADAGAPYTLIFTGLAEGDHWFVRAAQYPGVCVALAFERTVELGPGQVLARRHQVYVCDGVRTREQAAVLADLG